MPILPNVIVVEGDFPFWRGFLVEEWKRLGIRTICLTQAPGLWRRGDFDELEPLPVGTDGSLDVAGLRALVQRFGPVAGALTVFEPSVGRALEVQRALGLPPISHLEPRALRNKAAMVEVMTGRGLDAPRTVAGMQADDVVARSLHELQLPVVVKPSELAGKAGVRLVREEGELRPAVEAALGETLGFEIDGRAVSVVSLWGCEQGVLVQEYIEGPEYSVEGFSTCGEPVILAVTQKLESGPPLFEELGHGQPARLSDADERRIRDYAAAACRAFGLVHSAFHLELRLSPRGPVMMEINCRIAGDMIGRLLELRSGMNVGAMLVDLALGRRVDPPPSWVGAAAVRMATVREGGTMRDLRAPVLRSDREMAAFEAVPGSPVHPPKPGGVSRIGFLVATGDTLDAAEARLDQMAGEIRVDIEPAAGA